MQTIVRVLLTLFSLIFGFECMVDAFHRLNQPSDRAVYSGMAILGLLCVFLPALLYHLWRHPNDHLR